MGEISGVTRVGTGLPPAKCFAYAHNGMCGWVQARGAASDRAVLAITLAMAMAIAACGDEPGAPEEAPAIRFTPAAQTFLEPFELVLHASLEGASVHYTLDGSLPTREAPSWSEPIAIDQTTVVRAVAIRGEGPNEERTKVEAAHYLRAASATMELSSSLPWITLHMLGRGSPANDGREYQRAGMQLFEPQAGRSPAHRNARGGQPHRHQGARA